MEEEKDGEKIDHRLGRSTNQQKGCGIIRFWTRLFESHKG